MNSERKYVLALLGTVVVWAASFIFVKISLGEIGPFNLALYRFLVAAPVLYIILRAPADDFRRLSVGAVHPRRKETP